MGGRCRGGDARVVLVAALLLLAGCARLEIPAIGLREPIVKGGQLEIDAGHVVDYVALDGVGADVWLAGHHTTHGAVFRNLDELEPGDRLTAYGRLYTVVRVIRRTDRSFPGFLGPLVLQTSEGSGVLLVVAA